MKKGSRFNISRVVVAGLIVAVFFAVTVYGLVWTIQEGVKGSKYLKADAEIVECKKEEIDGVEITSSVTVECVGQGGERFEALFIGDYTRCEVGRKLTVYYKADDPSVVYPRSSDVGFALIALFGGLIWLVVSAVAIFALYRSGTFLSRSYDKPIEQEQEEEQ